MTVFGRSFSGGTWLWICLLLSLLLSLGSAQIIRPSSEDLPTPSLRYQLRIKHHRRLSISLAALTPSLNNDSNPVAKDFSIDGTLRNVDPANAADLEDSDIAFLSCDSSAYSGNLGANETIESVITASARAAILLYSTESERCSYAESSGVPDFERIFTLLDQESASQILDKLESPGGREINSRIMSDLAAVPAAPTSEGGSGQNSAMIILYSITGIITALFLGIIITGAIRAHRHPERYGPRTGTGITRQSRARGIARAMLETIPIVKFGDQEDPNKDAPKQLDVEMTAGHDGNDPNGSHDSVNRDSTSDNAVHGGLNDTDTTEPKGNDGSNEASDTATAPNTKPRGTDAEASHIGSLGCSICTDDFVKGQDIRVLPCDHRFHPECVDPWLVNVSGTCPLCRIDLNPPLSEHGGPAHGETESGSDHQAPTESTEHGRHTTHHRWALSSYIHDTLNARRMRDASVEERIATLRRLRREQQNNVAAAPTEPTPQTPTGRSHRLSSRIRDSFRIRTRQHGDDSTPSTEPGS